MTALVCTLVALAVLGVILAGVLWLLGRLEVRWEREARDRILAEHYRPGELP